MSPKIAQVVVGLPIDGPFDYSVNKNLRKKISIGSRVRIQFNRQIRCGYVVGLSQKSRFKKLKPVMSVLDEDQPSLSQKSLKLTKSFSEYYGCSWGEAIETLLPNFLKRPQPFKISLNGVHRKNSIKKRENLLIHDVSFNKKWPVLAKRIEKVVNEGRTVIFLVPEKSYVPFVAVKLKSLIDIPVHTKEKSVSVKSDEREWLQIKKAVSPILIGTRSSVFAPLPHLGLIVIYDEEHHAFKQEQTPHYHVHEVAELRSDIEGCSVLYVSSTPSAEIWNKVKAGKLKKMTLVDKSASQMQIVDMTNYNPQKSSLLSFPLQNNIQKCLENHQKIIIFLNRKGFSTRTSCNECGHAVKCQRCDVNMTFMYSVNKMICRHCSQSMDVPKVCPSCSGKYLRKSGTGIEKIESEVARVFPQARTARFEKDTKKFPNETDIVLATQAVFRIHEPLSTDLVAMLNFDTELNRHDYRSGEKAFALLVHLKQMAKDKLLIQTRMPDNYCIATMKNMNFNKFFNRELELRKELGFPPFKHLIALVLRGPKDEVVFDQTKNLFERLSSSKTKSIEMTEPHPDVIPKLRDKYRYTILLKGESVKLMLKHIKSVLKGFRRKNNVILTVNVDP